MTRLFCYAVLAYPCASPPQLPFSMFHTHTRVLAAALALTFLLPLSACDETGDLSGATAEQQVSNVRAARQQARQTGDYSTALRLIEAAYAAYPSDASVRNEYGLVLLQSENVNLLDLDRVAQFVNNETGGTLTAPPTANAHAGTCALASDPTAAPFDPTDFATFPVLAASRAEIQQALALLDPIIPDALQNFSLCTGFVLGDEGYALNYDQAAALAEMRASGLDDDEISAALATNAIARFLNAYFFLTQDLPQATQWYRTDNGAGIGVCADDPDALLDQAEEAVADLGEAAFSIDLRAATFGATSTSQELVDLVIDGYIQIRDGIGAYCVG